MKIGIIGAGNIGTNAAKLFTRAGHEIALRNSRGAETLKDLIAEIKGKAQAATIEEAARFGEIVLVAIPFGKYKTLPAEALRGKIVIDAGNYYPNRDGQIPKLDSGETTSSELMSAHLHGARLVKAFNTICYVQLAEQGDANLPIEDRRAIFIAGDDSQAKAIAAELIEAIGFAAVDTGTLHQGGKRQQPETGVYNRTLTARDAREILG